jgi:excisionase family DNA binding protein
MSNEPYLLSVAEAAKLLRVGRTLAYEMIARGELPSVRLGRTIRVPRSSLQEWIVQATTGGTAFGEVDGLSRLQ